MDKDREAIKKIVLTLAQRRMSDSEKMDAITSAVMEARGDERGNDPMASCWVCPWCGTT